MNKYDKKTMVHDIICIGRMCHRCKIYECKPLYGAEVCIDVPLEPHLKYARELYLKKDITFFRSMEALEKDERYAEIIEIIKSGGVQYD